MDDAFVGQGPRVTERQRETIREWQKTARFYEQVQALQRGVLDVSALAAAEYGALRRRIADLDAAIASAQLLDRVTAYRGVRSLQRTFGVDRAEDVPEHPEPLQGYVAASLSSAIALEQFTAPGGALLEIDVPAGTPALWVAGLGDPRLRYQQEILLPNRLRLRVTAIRHEDGLPVLSVQVI